MKFVVTPCRSCRKPAYGVRCRTCTDQYLRWLDGGAAYVPETDGVQDPAPVDLPPEPEEDP